MNRKGICLGFAQLSFQSPFSQFWKMRRKWKSTFEMWIDQWGKEAKGIKACPLGQQWCSKKQTTLKRESCWSSPLSPCFYTYLKNSSPWKNKKERSWDKKKEHDDVSRARLLRGCAINQTEQEVDRCGGCAHMWARGPMHRAWGFWMGPPTRVVWPIFDQGKKAYNNPTPLLFQKPKPSYYCLTLSFSGFFF